jgi:hypothetical protein
MTQSVMFGHGSNPPMVAGLYTPTLTAVTNIAAITMNSTFASYFRIGDLVFIFSTIYIDPTATGAAEFKMSIPIAADFSSGTARANGILASGVAGESGRVQSNTADNTLGVHFNAASTADHTFCLTASYRLN